MKYRNMLPVVCVFCDCWQDVGASAKELGYLSGKYSMELIVGDAVIENPFSWILVRNVVGIVFCCTI